MIKIEHKLLLSVFLIALGNIAYIVNDKLPIQTIIGNVAILCLFIVFLLINGAYGNKKILSYALFVFSVVTLWSTGYRDPTGVYIFLMSYHGIRTSKKTVFVYIFIFSTVIVCKYIYLGLDIPELLTFLAGTTLYITLFLHFTPKDDTLVLFEQEIEDIDPKVVEIMNLRCQDFDWWPISAKLNLEIKGESVRSIISKEKKRLNIINPEAFTFRIMSETRKNRPEAESDGFQDKNMV